MRRKEREVTDLKDITNIIEQAKYLHMGLFDGDFPYVVPMHYGYEYDAEKHAFLFYLHSAEEGHKLDLIRKNQNVCIELECGVASVSGGEIPCRYGAVYASVIGRGKAELLENEEEKAAGLTCLMRHQTGRRFEITEQMAASVAVIKVTVFEFTAKSRTLSGN